MTSDAVPHPGVGRRPGAGCVRCRSRLLEIERAATGPAVERSGDARWVLDATTRRAVAWAVGRALDRPIGRQV